MFYNKTAAVNDEVIKRKHVPRHWPFVRGIHRSPMNSPHKSQWRGALMFSLICAWANNGDTGDFRRHRAHYDVIIMCAERSTTVHEVNTVMQMTFSKCVFLNENVSISTNLFLRYVPNWRYTSAHMKPCGITLSRLDTIYTHWVFGTIHALTVPIVGCLNIKMSSCPYMDYRDCHYKDKTVLFL